jgi:hypothetical protein
MAQESLLMIPILVFAPARSRGTAFIEAFESPENVILYEPLNPRVGPRFRQKLSKSQQAQLSHSEDFDYFKGLREVQAETIYPRPLRTVWRQGFVTTKQRGILEEYLRHLIVAATEIGKRAVFKFEHPVLFHIASSTITPHLTVGLSRPSGERLNSYWMQVLEKNNHYFFQRDFSWGLTHPSLRKDTWSSLIAGFMRPITLYHQTFHRVDGLCQQTLTSCDIIIDANSGQVIGGSGEETIGSQPNEMRAELFRALGDFEAQIYSRIKNETAKSASPADMGRTVRNYIRLTGTVARAVIYRMANRFFGGKTTLTRV